MKAEDIEGYLVAIGILAVAAVIGVLVLLGHAFYQDFGYDPVARDVERLLDFFWRLHELILDRCLP